VLAGHGGAEGSIQRRMATYGWSEMCELQGLPADFELPGLTREAKRKAVGNGVPLPMGRAVARAVKQAMGYTFDSERQTQGAACSGLRVDPVVAERD
jgi:hypothetical protein